MQGVRILVVEDEFLLACSLEEDLRAAGATVIGPCCDLDQALAALHNGSFDAAILDINLNGVMVYPLAEELLTRGIPFLFLTGYGTLDLPEAYRALPRVSKPYSPAVLAKAVKNIVAKPD